MEDNLSKHGMYSWKGYLFSWVFLLPEYCRLVSSGWQNSNYNAANSILLAQFMHGIQTCGTEERNASSCPLQLCAAWAQQFIIPTLGIKLTITTSFTHIIILPLDAINLCSQLCLIKQIKQTKKTGTRTNIYYSSFTYMPLPYYCKKLISLNLY
jgi:hypothetical protein